MSKNINYSRLADSERLDVSVDGVHKLSFYRAGDLSEVRDGDGNLIKDHNYDIDEIFGELSWLYHNLG